MVMAEEYLEDEGHESAWSITRLPASGASRPLIEVHRGRFGEHTCNYYDAEWNPVRIDWAGIPVSPVEVERPENLKEMLELSAELARGVPQVRCDWYVLGERLIFGELTLFNGAGLDLIDDENDLKLGSLIDLGLAYGD